jgi:hypothetical protein
MHPTWSDSSSSASEKSKAKTEKITVESLKGNWKFYQYESTYPNFNHKNSINAISQAPWTGATGTLDDMASSKTLACKLFYKSTYKAT